MLRGPFLPFNAHSIQYGQLSARSWRPATEIGWKRAKPYSFWDSAAVGLAPSSWASFPKAAASAPIPAQIEMDHTEVFINSPSFFSHSATVSRHLTTGGPPPPSPHIPESSWGAGASSANYAKATRAPPDLYDETPESCALQQLAGADLLRMFEGSQCAEKGSFVKTTKMFLCCIGPGGARRALTREWRRAAHSTRRMTLKTYSFFALPLAGGQRCSTYAGS